MQLVFTVATAFIVIAGDASRDLSRRQARSGRSRETSVRLKNASRCTCTPPTTPAPVSSKGTRGYDAASPGWRHRGSSERRRSQPRRRTRIPPAWFTLVHRRRSVCRRPLSGCDCSFARVAQDSFPPFLFRRHLDDSTVSRVSWSSIRLVPITWKVLTVTNGKRQWPRPSPTTEGVKGSKKKIRVSIPPISKWITIQVRWRLSLCRDCHCIPIFVAADCKSSWYFLILRSHTTG